jgi:hypothetical protein
VTLEVALQIVGIGRTKQKECQKDSHSVFCKQLHLNLPNEEAISRGMVLGKILPLKTDVSHAGNTIGHCTDALRLAGSFNFFRASPILPLIERKILRAK